MAPRKIKRLLLKEQGHHLESAQSSQELPKASLSPASNPEVAFQDDSDREIDEGEDYGDEDEEEEVVVGADGKKTTRKKGKILPLEGAKQAHLWREQYKGLYTIPDDYQPPVIPHTPNLPYIPFNGSKYQSGKPWVPTNQELLSIEARKYHPNIRGPIRHVMTVEMLKANRLPDEFLPLPTATPRQKFEAMLAREGFKIPDDLFTCFHYADGFQRGMNRGRKNTGGYIVPFFDPAYPAQFYGFLVGLLKAINNCLELNVIDEAKGSGFRARINDALCAPPGGSYLVEHTWKEVKWATHRFVTTCIKVGDELSDIHSRLPCRGHPDCVPGECACDLPEDALVPDAEMRRWRTRWGPGSGRAEPAEIPDTEDEDDKPKFRHFNGPGSGFQNTGVIFDDADLSDADGEYITDPEYEPMDED